QQGGQRRRDDGPILALGERRVRTLVVHAGAAVEDERGLEVRLLLVLLDMVAVGAGIDLPVNVAYLIAGNVVAMLRELDAAAPVRAFVHPGDDALDDGAGAQF